MPTVLRDGPYRVFFFSHEPGEPPHVHVHHAGKTAKFWLEPVRPASGGRFAEHELTRIRRMLECHEWSLREAWNAHFDG